MIAKYRLRCPHCGQAFTTRLRVPALDDEELANLKATLKEQADIIAGIRKQEERDSQGEIL